MPRNYVVLRRSPDWTTFRLEDTRAFCRDVGVDENAIIDFAALWDATFPVDYLAYRQAMKGIALECVHRVRNAEVISHLDLPSMTFVPDDLLYFTDDDDWVQPELLHALRVNGSVSDGWLWDSASVGSRYDAATDTHSGVLNVRPGGAIAFTNNYAVTGAAWSRLGSMLLEHFTAQHALDDHRLSLQLSPQPLSAANKHLCCTTFIVRGERGAVRPTDLRAALTAMTDDLAKVTLTPELAWMGEPLSAFAEVSRRVLEQR